MITSSTSCILAVALIALMLCLPVHAIEYPTNIPSTINGFAFGESGSKVFLSARMYLSRNGEPFERVVGKSAPPIQSNNCKYIAAEFTKDDTHVLLATSGASGIFEYSVVDDEWSVVGPLFGGRSVSAMAKSHLTGYILAGFGGIQYQHNSGDATGLYLTKDDGVSWTLVDKPDSSWKGWAGVEYIVPMGKYWLIGFRGFDGLSTSGRYIWSESSGWRKLGETSFNGKIVTTSEYIYTYENRGGGVLSVSPITYQGAPPNSTLIRPGNEILELSNLGRDSAVAFVKDSFNNIVPILLSGSNWTALPPTGMKYYGNGTVRCYADVISNTLVVTGAGYQRQYAIDLASFDSVKLASPSPHIEAAFSISDSIYLRITDHGWLKVTSTMNFAIPIELRENLKPLLTRQYNESVLLSDAGKEICRFAGGQLDTLVRRSDLEPGSYTLFNDAVQYNDEIILTTFSAIYTYNITSQTLEPVDTTTWPRAGMKRLRLQAKATYLAEEGYLVWMQGDNSPEETQSLGGLYLRTPDEWKRIQAFDALGSRTNPDHIALRNGQLAQSTVQYFTGAFVSAPVVSLFNIQSNKLMSFVDDNQFAPSISCLNYLSDSTLWVSTNYGKSFIINIHEATKYSLPDWSDIVLEAGPIGERFWIATRDSGLIVLDNEDIATTEVKNTSNTIDQCSTFPLPSLDNSVSFGGLQTSSIVSVKIVNATSGQVILEDAVIVSDTGVVTIDTQVLTAGTYIAHISWNGGYCITPVIRSK